MSNTVIKVENLSKQYRLGEVGTGTISHDINRWWAKVRGKEDPFLKIGESNDRTTKGNSDYVWALQDINFEVKQGEVLGIIGRNGAGKSTLLKILSKTTMPTTGNIKVKGRIASLLEVGTGFHPEMTGRENIFLNGAILGMTRKEIKSKFDEIVDFSGVERYIDTPVKRYSSGMYVRLAFAVAAHLEPEILIVDEVLAVGDAEFQKKCLGKMKDVSGQGRTVLFVSHNMVAVKSLCNNGILMNDGRISIVSEIDKVIDNYLMHNNRSLTENKNLDILNPIINEFIQFTLAKCYSRDLIFKTNSEIIIEFLFIINKPINLNLSLILRNSNDIVVFNTISETKELSNGSFSSTLVIPSNFLNDGRFYVDIYFIDSEKLKPISSVNDVIAFDIEDKRDTNWVGKWQGVVRPQLKFTINEK